MQSDRYKKIRSRIFSREGIVEFIQQFSRFTVCVTTPTLLLQNQVLLQLLLLLPLKSRVSEFKFGIEEELHKRKRD